jgi:4-hydroxy-tetrahydrodipicolinate synthase
MDLRTALQTAVAVTITPFDPADRVDEVAYRAIIGRMVAAGVRAVTANGNTGEFYALSPSEVDRCVDLAVEAARHIPTDTIGGTIGDGVGGGRDRGGGR